MPEKYLSFSIFILFSPSLVFANNIICFDKWHKEKHYEIRSKHVHVLMLPSCAIRNSLLLTSEVFITSSSRSIALLSKIIGIMEDGRLILA